MIDSWLVLIPPLLTIFLVFLLRRSRLSLMLGVLFAAFLARDFHFWPTILLVGQRLIEVSEIQSLWSWDLLVKAQQIYVFGFLLIIDIFVRVVRASGAPQVYAAKIAKKASTPKEAQFFGLLLPLAVFIDEDISSGLAASTIPCLTDFFGIARMRVGEIIASLTVPIALLIPLSGWAAAISMFLEQSGVSQGGFVAARATVLHNPYLLYLKSLTFFYFPILVLFTMVVSILCYKAVTNEPDVNSQKSAECSSGKVGVGLRDLFYPVISLPILVIAGTLLFSRLGQEGGESLVDVLVAGRFIEMGLFVGGCIALFFVMAWYRCRGVLSWRELGFVTQEGFFEASGSISALLLALTMANLLRSELHAGRYLAINFFGDVPFLLLPVVFFLFAALTAFCIGSDWGTLAVVLPISIEMMVRGSGYVKPIVVEQVPAVLVVVGAVVSGANIGFLLSPASYLIEELCSNLGLSMQTFQSRLSLFFSAPFLGTCLSLLVASWSLFVGFNIFAAGLMGVGAGALLASLGFFVLRPGRE